MLQLLLWLAMTMPTADSAPCVSASGAVEVTVPKGTTVHLCFETPTDTNLRYFRIRRAQTQEGSYDFWQRLYMADCVSINGTTYCGLVFSATHTEHYFVTTVYADANDVLHETVGSSHARVNVTP